MGADPDEAADSGRNKGYTCLMMAARNNKPELASLLIKYKSDVNKKADDGKSALSLAKEEHNDEMVNLLKSQGASE